MLCESGKIMLDCLKVNKFWKIKRKIYNCWRKSCKHE